MRYTDPILRLVSASSLRPDRAVLERVRGARAAVERGLADRAFSSHGTERGAVPDRQWLLAPRLGNFGPVEGFGQNRSELG
jgi:hypothetical protein